MDARVEPDIRLDGEKPLPERNFRVFEDCAFLVVELPSAILTRIPLEHSVAAVPNIDPARQCRQ